VDPLLALDKALGDAVERVVRGHHHRRLRRLGWKHALEPGGDGLWVSGDPPPRDGNAVELLIDGAAALPRIASELRKASSHVHIAGWYVSPGFELTRDGNRADLRTLLSELAERIDVRVLVWGGSPFPLSVPTVETSTAFATRSSSVRGFSSPRTRRNGRCTVTTRSSWSSTTASRSSAAST